MPRALNHDDRRADPLRAAPSRSAPAVAPGQHQVEHADVGPLVAKPRQPLLALADHDGSKPAAREVRGHALGDHRVVLDDQDTRHPRQRYTEGRTGMIPPMRVRFTPQRREFFELFARASANAVDIARLLCELLELGPPNDGDLVGRIKDLEHTGDELTHEVVDLLNRTFVTPFDRDDIYRLASAIDDVCDFMDEAAGNLSRTASPRCPSGRSSRRT